MSSIRYDARSLSLASIADEAVTAPVTSPRRSRPAACLRAAVAVWLPDRALSLLACPPDGRQPEVPALRRNTITATATAPRWQGSLNGQSQIRLSTHGAMAAPPLCALEPFCELSCARWLLGQRRVEKVALDFSWHLLSVSRSRALDRAAPRRKSLSCGAVLSPLAS